MTDTTKTREQLVTMAANELLIVGSSQSLQDEDQQTIDGRIDGLFAELSLRGVVDVSDDGAIPIEYCGALAELLANECAPAFGKQKMAPPARESIEERLRVITQRIPASSKYLKTDTALQGGGSIYTHARWTSGT